MGSSPSLQRKPSASSVPHSPQRSPKQQRPNPRAMPSAGAGGKPRRSASAIFTDTASGYHLLTVHGYSRTKGVPTGERVKSRPFDIGGHRWRIDYYPNGVRAEVAGYVSLSLMLDEDEGVAAAPAVKAQYDIRLAGEAEDEDEGTAPLASASVDDFTPGRGWVYTTFVAREELEGSEHLRNASFTVRYDIVVVRDYRAEDAAAAFVSVPACDLRRDLAGLLHTEKGADVVFEFGGETVAAHRCVLAARSSVFAAELFGPMKEGNADAGVVVRVEDMKPEVFKALLRFAYTGLLPETRKEDQDVTCQHVLVAADRYGMRRLKLICEEKLCECINVGSAAIVLALAEQHRCEGLKKACFDFLAAPANLRAVVATEGFQHLSRSCPSLMAEVITMSLGKYY
ncbi:BTB/POZ and MATH domain-containing protein 2-like [Triticum dicoccoides]|uniref:BTB/POZ and MATH domain-containing protein 2-like n=1 Tax=Triticum dicoccoides TaxID=85692 RepID=UPI001891CFEF|nr:BTB/POZ and MATH domain-containing protein 2-like [Triticum dicoccoides]